jgi:pre-mRNA-processing factor SLU7
MEPNNDNNEPKKSASVRQLLRQQRELQEKRKFGLAPLAVDTETHQEISPNIPEFISRAPWYYGAAGPTLAHQRKLGGKGNAQASDEELHDSVDQIVVKGKAARFTAGACKNCGSRTHKTNECIQAKKKVGSVYTNKVTGVDMEIQQTSKTYAQKRDRFVGDVGVDLMRAVRQDSDDGDGDSTSRGPGAVGPASKLARPEDVFGTRTAQHGGLEVKELPKYLHNLDQQDGLFFDPKTGSMRANPNASDSTKAFQGDLERYRSGDYFNYVESQYRFLTGQSKSFVDFEFDEAMRRAREQAEEGNNGSKATAEVRPETPQDILLRSLYGAGRTTVSAEKPAGLTGERMSNVAHHGDNTPSPSPPSAPTIKKEGDAVRVPASSSASSGSLIKAAAVAWIPTHNGHSSVYGSYFDSASFQWGYACCKATRKDAPGCTNS